jgi:myo-inositol-1(or 4)-monophosphatase
MLCHVANGIFDVYYEKDIYIWDVAAGLSLVEEAGGQFFLRRTPGTFKYEVLASNKALFQKAKSLLIK